MSPRIPHNPRTLSTRNSHHSAGDVANMDPAPTLDRYPALERDLAPALERYLAPAHERDLACWLRIRILKTLSTINSHHSAGDVANMDPAPTLDSYPALERDLAPAL